MGDRGQIEVRGEFIGSVYFYTHWGSSEMLAVVRSALTRAKGKDGFGGRWDDAPYLARIIFSELIQGDVLALTGYGISGNTFTDINRTVTVDINSKTVTEGEWKQTFEEITKKEEVVDNAKLV